MIFFYLTASILSTNDNHISLFIVISLTVYQLIECKHFDGNVNRLQNCTFDAVQFYLLNIYHFDHRHQLNHRLLYEVRTTNKRNEDNFQIKRRIEENSSSWSMEIHIAKIHSEENLHSLKNESRATVDVMWNSMLAWREGQQNWLLYVNCIVLSWIMNAMDIKQ